MYLLCQIDQQADIKIYIYIYIESIKLTDMLLLINLKDIAECSVNFIDVKYYSVYGLVLIYLYSMVKYTLL